ncbi:MAG: AAA family ATPase [Deltaproteobacteria bacterium]|nr:AAA family ATPase [Deltaproteobacteria bacterium]
MIGKIERFHIKGLHGHKNFDLPFTDNTIILVGENGTGKTTVLRLLYYLLSAQWGSLARYKFDELVV